MEFVIKKDDENPSGLICLEDLKSLIKDNKELDSIKNTISEIDNNLERLVKNMPKDITKSDILKLVSNNTVASFKAINITNIESIEKSKIIPLGTIYYNEKLDKVRLKTKKGWINLNN